VLDSYIANVGISR